MSSILILMVVIIFGSLLGLLILIQNPKGRINQFYLGFTVSAIVLVVANYLSLDSGGDQLASVRAVMVAASIGIFLLYMLVRSMLFEKHSHAVYFAMMFSSITVACFDVSPLLFRDIISSIPPQPVGVGPGIVIFVVHFVVFAGMTLAMLVSQLRSKNKAHRHQSIILVVGIVPILFLAPVTGVIMPLVFNAPHTVLFTPIYILIFLSSIAYAIIRYGLFSIKRATARTFVYALSLGSLSLIYFLLAFVVQYVLVREGDSQNPMLLLSNVGLALLLAFSYQPVKSFFDHATEQLFFRTQYRLEDLLSRASEVMVSANSIISLADGVSRELSTILKPEYAMLVLDVRGVRTVGYSESSRMRRSERTKLIAYAEKLMLQQHSYGPVEIIPRQRLDPRNESVQLAIVLPMQMDVSGVIILGEQKIGTEYSQKDIQVLKTIASWLVIAARSAQSLLDVQELNTHLQRKIDDATKELRISNKRLLELDSTKDEFVSMASHQLRTPLTSIKGYISMILEGDAGAISDSQRKLLTEAFSSSERMVHLIGDFLNVSRLQTGKFMLDRQPTDLSKLVGQEIEGIKQIAVAHTVKVKYNKPARTPMLYVDEGKIRQVVMNFLDNAVYYSPDATSIEVDLYIQDGDIVLHVIDSGMGVPKDVQKHLFTKFFRAENARTQRPDGTGIGLYLAKKIIDAHGGAVTVKSDSGKGSTFGFRLPVAKLSLPPKDNT